MGPWLSRSLVAAFLLAGVFSPSAADCKVLDVLWTEHYFWNFVPAETWSFQLVPGYEYSFHYNRIMYPNTPPEASLVVLKAFAWYRQKIGFYISTSVSPEGDSLMPAIYGLGVRLPFLVQSAFTRQPFLDSHPAIGGIVASFQVEASYLGYPAPTSDSQLYTQNGFAPWLGFDINLGLGQSRYFIDVTMMGGFFSHTILVRPFLGLGVQF